jgi:electron transfer flavoprotein alpha/beta subunit
VIMGDGNLAAYMAAANKWLQATSVVDVEQDGAKSQLVCMRLLERGDRQMLSCPLPAVVSVHVDAYVPQYISVFGLQACEGLPIERHVVTQIPEYKSPMQLVELSQPRARPKRIAAPTATMTAAQRITFLMKGGNIQPAVTNTNLAEGTLEQVVNRVFEFLQERGFIK